MSDSKAIVEAPKDYFIELDRRDQQQIVMHALGDVVGELFYKVHGRDSLSWEGINTVAYLMGDIEMDPWVEWERVEMFEGRVYWSATVRARNTKYNLASMGTAESPELMDVYDRDERGNKIPDPERKGEFMEHLEPDEFCRRKALSKAQRNAKRAVMPTAVLGKYLQYFIDLKLFKKGTRTQKPEMPFKPKTVDAEYKVLGDVKPEKESKSEKKEKPKKTPPKEEPKPEKPEKSEVSEDAQPNQRYIYPSPEKLNTPTLDFEDAIAEKGWESVDGIIETYLSDMGYTNPKEAFEFGHDIAKAWVRNAPDIYLGDAFKEVDTVLKIAGFKYNRNEKRWRYNKPEEPAEEPEVPSDEPVEEASPKEEEPSRGGAPRSVEEVTERIEASLPGHKDLVMVSEYEDYYRIGRKVTLDTEIENHLDVIVSEMGGEFNKDKNEWRIPKEAS